MPLDSVVIRAPADMHAHFRDGDMLKVVVPYTAAVCDIALAMPNLKPPITKLRSLAEYRSEVLAEARAVNPDFQLLPTLYLTDELGPDVVMHAYRYDGGHLAYAVKTYPRGGTHNSADGVTDMRKVHRTLTMMEQIGMPLCIHGEVTVWDGIEVPQHDRERIYMLEELPKLQRDHPGLKIVLEHLSTKEGVEAVENGIAGMIAGTITPQHLMLTAADLFRGGARVHGVCMPIVKTHNDRVALRRAATSGSSRFFAGTDSAPHLKKNKEAACCAFGAFTAPAMTSLYAQVFAEEGALDDEKGVLAFSGFMSVYGPLFYGVNPSARMVELRRKSWTPSFEIKVRDDEVIAFADPRAGFVNELWYQIAS
ncbi:MAG: dihydroorotase [Candidatus Pacebacteria bacterium]|nr:dihydroorotase [Candidatus Paceibacterota bacterium]MBP9840196.1 dihydroorotase [Candidatus Paceibacterota bacterium]